MIQGAKCCTLHVFALQKYKVSLEQIGSRGKIQQHARVPVMSHVQYQ
jgi:hypothetical protein